MCPRPYSVNRELLRVTRELLRATEKGVNKMIRTVIIVLLLIVHAHAASPEFTPGWSETFHTESIEFMSIFYPVQEKIEENRDESYDLEDGSKNPILKPQRLWEAPDFWFVPLLLGRGIKRTEFAFRSDNLYMSAFANGAGEWFRFDVPSGEYVIEGTTSLGFGSNYDSLLEYFEKRENSGNQAWEKLEGLELGRDAVLDSIDVMDGYDKKTTPKSSIKRALVIIIVVFIESQRFPHIRQLVYQAWKDGHGTLDRKGAELVANWKRTSCAIRIWDASTDKARWDSREAIELMRTGLGITTPELAKAQVWPIIQSDNCSK